MKLAFTVSSAGDHPSLERRFGRCPYFLIVDTETRDRECLPNPSTVTRGGAGTQAAQFLAARDVDAVVSGEFGPNAFATLDAAGIRMYTAQGGQVDALVEDFLAERLARVMTNTGGYRRDRRRIRSGRKR